MTEIINITAVAVTTALVIVTSLYLRQTNKLIKISNRPQVLLYSNHGNIIIENIGTQTAFNIRFDTKTPNYKEYTKGCPIKEWSWYKNGVIMLPPQKGYIIHDPTEKGDLIQEQPPCEIEITYYTARNRKGKKYKEPTYIGIFPGRHEFRSQLPLQYSNL